MTLIHQFTLLIILSNIIIHPTGPFQHAIPEILEIPLIKPILLPLNHPKYPQGHRRIMGGYQKRKGTHQKVINLISSIHQYSFSSEMVQFR